MIDPQLITDKILQVRSTLNEAKKNFYSKNYYEFVRDILVPDSDLYEPLHRKVCDFVINNVDKKKLLILLPRGSFKSSVVTVGYSLYRIINNPNDRILIANATYPMATQFLGQIKNFLQRNERLKDIFGDFSESADQWREDRIFIGGEQAYTTKEPTVWAQGVAANVVGSHFNIAILDDLVSDVNVGTKEQIEKVKQYYRGVLDLVDPTNGHQQVIIIGTTWHWDDLYAWIMETPEMRANFEVLRLPAYEGEFKKGELLFPKRLSWDILEKKRSEQGSYHFAAQYMLSPIPEENQTFRPPFKRYEESDIRGLELRKFITVDPAISEKKEADYSAMTCVGVDKNNTWYILDIWQDKVLPKALIDQMFFWNEKWKPISMGIEVVAFQKVLQYALNEEMRKRNKFIPIKELKHVDKSKDERIRALQPRYEIGTIFHPDKITCPLIEDYENQLLRFPRASHDDMIDSMAAQLELAFPPRKHEERSERAKSHYPA